MIAIVQPEHQSPDLPAPERRGQRLRRLYVSLLAWALNRLLLVLIGVQRRVIARLMAGNAELYPEANLDE